MLIRRPLRHHRWYVRPLSALWMMRPKTKDDAAEDNAAMEDVVEEDAVAMQYDAAEIDW